MKDIFMLCLVTSVLLLSFSLVNVKAATGWSHTYGGSGYDSVSGLVATSDGGYAIAGSSTSFGTSGDVWLVKTDSQGNMQWNKTLGASSGEIATAFIGTSDGGYAIAGYVDRGPMGTDAWLIKTDSTGNKQWNMSYGGIDYDRANALVRADDGYALAGSTNSSGAGSSDFWLIRTDSSGNMLWNKTYGGPSSDQANSLIKTNDGYALAGSTNATNSGKPGFWLVKTDSQGNMQWNKTYTGNERSIAQSVIAASDGGYAIVGQTNSVMIFSGNYWLIKTDSAGNAQWNQTYGGPGEDDEPHSVVQVSDGYMLAGATNASGAGSYDAWLVKTDTSGKMVWNKTYGGSGGDAALALIATTDGGYVFAGYTTSFGAGSYDFWLVKVDASEVPEFPALIVLPLLMAAVAIVVASVKRHWSRKTSSQT